MEEGRGIREVSRAAYAVIKTGYTESDGRCHASLERVALRDGAVGWAVHFRPGQRPPSVRMTCGGVMEVMALLHGLTTGSSPLFFVIVSLSM